MRQVILDKINSSPEDQVDLQNMQLIDSEISETMTKIIKAKPNIKELFLDRNQITDDGAEIVAQHLPKLPNLTFMTMEYNQLDKKGFTALFDAQYAIGAEKFTLALHGNLMHNVGEVEKLKNQVKNTYKK